MMSRYLTLSAFVLLLPALTLYGDDTAPPHPSANSSGLTLTPGPDITLMPGEHTLLTVFDSTTNKPVPVMKITWKIGRQSIGDAGPTAGSLDVPADNPNTTSAIYTAPAQVPAKPTMELKASVATSSPPVILTTRITIINDPNWFAIEGDPAPGNPPGVSIQLDPKLPSTAGVHNGPLIQQRGDYFVSVFGTDKRNPNFRVRVDLTLGKIPNGQTGTFFWNGAGPVLVGAEAFCPGAAYLDRDLNDPAKPATLGGSTTLLEPSVNDNSGLVRGFYAGNLSWVELLKSPPGLHANNIKIHYATIRGDFAVPLAK